MRSIKPGVKLFGVKPEMVLVDSVVADVLDQNGFACIHTSITGKKHGTGSLHPAGYAIDYRSKHIHNIGDKYRVLKQLIDALPCCDVAFEYPGGEQEHYHVEFDPKDDADFQNWKRAYQRGEYD